MFKGAILVPITTVFLLGAPMPAQQGPILPAAVRGAAEVITAAHLKNNLYFIASDELEGRGTPSRGQDIAAKFIVTHLSGWPVKPQGDDGTYFQRIPVNVTRMDPAQSSLEINGKRFRFPDDFGPGTGPSPDAPEVISGPLVYVSHGWVIKSEGVDAYQGVDVKGKIMIVSQNPHPLDPNWRPKGRRGIDWERPQDYAQKHGALGMVEIPSFRQLANWERDRDLRLARFRLAPEGQKRGDRIKSIALSLSVVNTLFSGERRSPEEVIVHAISGEPLPAFDLDPNKRLSLTIAVTNERANPLNVLATVEGGDPVLKNEYVVIGAHYDHLGIWNGSTNQAPPVANDFIYNGADDNGSGTVALMALAEAFARGPRPRRSILFAWWTGEEGYQLGSIHFTRLPTVPTKQIVAYLNVDSVGRTTSVSGPNDLNVSSSSTLIDRMTRAVNREYLNMTLSDRANGSSDELDSAIPIQFFDDGPTRDLTMEEQRQPPGDHHKTSDSADKIDYAKLERVARTVYVAAWAIANSPERPVQDKPRP